MEKMNTAMPDGIRIGLLWDYSMGNGGKRVLKNSHLSMFDVYTEGRFALSGVH